MYILSSDAFISSVTQLYVNFTIWKKDVPLPHKTFPIKGARNLELIYKKFKNHKPMHLNFLGSKWFAMDDLLELLT